MSSKKLAVITGGSKGIGFAIAEKLAENGIDLILIARSETDLNLAKEALEEKYGIICAIFHADLSVKSEAASFCQFVAAKYRKVDILVNNAGTFIQGNLMEEAEGALESQMNTNLYSAYYVTRGLVDLLNSEETKSHIFNICSIASLQAYKYSGSYTISKFALLGFSKSLREELKPKIKVTSIMPGATYTSSWESAGLPESRFIQASDIADIVWAAYQLSPSALVEDIVIRPAEGDI